MALGLLDAKEMGLVAHPFAVVHVRGVASWWVDWSLGRAIGFLHQTMVVNFKYINTDWQPRRASGRGTKKAQNTSTSPILLAYVLDNALRYPGTICRVSGT